MPPSLVNGVYVNYMLEKTPPNDRPSHMAWYTIILNIAILASSLVGPALADGIGLVNALIFIGVLRVLPGIAILKWG